MKEIYTEIEIHAPKQRVWQLLTDFARFPEWNPFIRSATGKLEVNAQLKVFIQPPGQSGMKFSPRVLRVQPEHELRWLGSLLLPGIFDGEHCFLIEIQTENQVRFIQREEFRGFLLPLLWKSLDTNTRQGFENMNAALKKLAEAP
jgi:hypothetical protein